MITTKTKKNQQKKRSTRVSLKKRTIALSPKRSKIKKQARRKGSEHVRRLEKEILALEEKFVKFGEDAVEDRADFLEDQIEKLVLQNKITLKQSERFIDRLEILDD